VKRRESEKYYNNVSGYVEIKCQLDATEVASSWHFISTY